MIPRRVLSRVGAFFPAAVWYFVIWRFSAQTAAASGALSDRLLYRLLECSSAVFRGQSEDGKQAIVLFLSFFERKAAHMFLYFVLAGLLLFALHGLFRKYALKVVGAFGLCAILAALDELHQYFVPGRSCELRDMAVDLTGGTICLLLCWLVRCIRLAQHRSDDL